MPRRGMFVSGVLLIVLGVLFPLAAFFNQISDADLMPFDVVADLSGAKTEVGFTARRSDTYFAFVAMKLPRGADAMASTRDCLLRNPDAEASTICKQKGQLAVIASIADTAGGVTSLNENDPPTGYETIGGTDVTATRDLGFFNTTAGHRYVVTARFKSDDPTIRQLKPHLKAFASATDIAEGIALGRFIFVVASVLGGILLVPGIWLALYAYSWREKAEPA